ncbi:hypothetical protein LUZ60_010940 [Juncus effusus]|nr:hypothetical protein LUZ60_010940 [Juncus effusus]
MGNSRFLCGIVYFLVCQTGIGVTVEYVDQFFDREYVLCNEDLVVLLNDTPDEEIKQMYKKGALCTALFRYLGKQVCFPLTNQSADVTESFSSRVLLIVMMTLSCWLERLSVKRNESIFKAIAELPDLDCQMKELAESFAREKIILLLGRGVHEGTGLECVRLFHGLGISSACIREETLRKRGPLEYQTCPLVVIAMRDHLFDKNIQTVRNLAGREGRIVIICTVGDRPLFTPYAFEVIEVPDVLDVFQPIVSITPIQMLVHHLE